MIRLLVVDHLAELGGSEVNLVTLLANLDRESFEPWVACPGDGPLASAVRRLGIPVLPLRMRGSATNMLRSASPWQVAREAVLGSLELARAIAQVRGWIRRTRPDVVYLNTLKAGLIGGIAARVAGVPAVEHVQDIVRAPEFGGILRAVMGWILCRVPRQLIAISEVVRRATIELGVPADRVVLVHNGIEVDRFAAPRDSIRTRARLGLDPERPTIGMTARLMRWKGQDVFLRAARLVEHDAQFVVAGGLFWEDPRFETELRELAESLGIADRVFFLGHRDDMDEVVAALDVVVHASLHPEPFGLTIVEGMAAGKAVIATRAGGPVEILEDGVHGLLVAPGDVAALAAAMNALLASASLRAALGRAARVRAAERFDVRRMAREIGDCVRRVARTDGPSLVGEPA